MRTLDGQEAWGSLLQWRRSHGDQRPPDRGEVVPSWLVYVSSRHYKITRGDGVIALGMRSKLTWFSNEPLSMDDV